MEENKITLKDCLKIMVDNLRIVEQAEIDCEAMCLASWDALLQSDPIIEEKDIAYKEIMKIAKSIAKRKIKKLEDEHKKLGILLNEVLKDNGEDDE